MINKNINNLNYEKQKYSKFLKFPETNTIFI